MKSQPKASSSLTTSTEMDLETHGKLLGQLVDVHSGGRSPLAVFGPSPRSRSPGSLDPWWIQAFGDELEGQLEMLVEDWLDSKMKLRDWLRKSPLSSEDTQPLNMYAVDVAFGGVAFEVICVAGGELAEPEAWQAFAQGDDVRHWREFLEAEMSTHREVHKASAIQAASVAAQAIAARLAARSGYQEPVAVCSLTAARAPQGLEPPDAQPTGHRDRNPSRIG